MTDAELIDSVFTHEWFHEIYRTDGCAPAYRWTIVYECANDGPSGMLSGHSYIEVCEIYHGLLC